VLQWWPLTPPKKGGGKTQKRRKKLGVFFWFFCLGLTKKHPPPKPPQIRTCEKNTWQFVNGGQKKKTPGKFPRQENPTRISDWKKGKKDCFATPLPPLKGQQLVVGKGGKISGKEKKKRGGPWELYIPRAPAQPTTPPPHRAPPNKSTLSL